MSVRLHRGVDPRTVRMVIATRLDEVDRLAPGSVVGAFLAAVGAGLFGRGSVGGYGHRIHVLREQGVMEDVFEATFSRIRPQAFAALVHMVEASVPGVTRLGIHELGRDERTLWVRGFERDPDPTLLDVDWPIEFASFASSCVRVCFHETPPQEVADKAGRLVRAWTELVRLGAYAPSGEEPASAVLQDVGPGRPGEIVAEFETLSCGDDAFEALFEGLDAVHDRHPIERVAIPSCLGGIHGASVLPPGAAALPVAFNSCGAWACG